MKGRISVSTTFDYDIPFNEQVPLVANAGFYSFITRSKGKTF